MATNYKKQLGHVPVFAGGVSILTTKDSAAMTLQHRVMSPGQPARSPLGPVTTWH